MEEEKGPREGKQDVTYQGVVERHLDLWVGADPPIGSVARSLRLVVLTRIEAGLWALDAEESGQGKCVVAGKVVLGVGVLQQ